MCELSIKVPIRKKSGNLFNDPRILDNFIKIFLAQPAEAIKYTDRISAEE